MKFAQSLRTGFADLANVAPDVPFEEMVKLDYLYVTSWSPGGDLGLLLRTIPIVLRRAGA